MQAFVSVTAVQCADLTASVHPTLRAWLKYHRTVLCSSFLGITREMRTRFLLLLMIIFSTFMLIIRGLSRWSLLKFRICESSRAAHHQSVRKRCQWSLIRVVWIAFETRNFRRSLIRLLLLLHLRTYLGLMRNKQIDFLLQELFHQFMFLEMQRRQHRRRRRLWFCLL